MTIHIGSRTADTRLDPYALEGCDPEALVAAATEALKHPSDASFWDGDLYVTHTLMYGTPDWSLTTEYIVGQANYRAILEDMSSAYARHPGAVEAASVGHWTYSRYQCIKVRVCYADGEIHPAFVDAWSIAQALECDYPVYSENTYSDLESEVWEYTVSEALADARRDDDAPAYRDSDDWEIAFREAVSEWFGYSGVDYISPEHLESATGAADGIVSAALSVGLTRPNVSGDTLSLEG